MSCPICFEKAKLVKHSFYCECHYLICHKCSKKLKRCMFCRLTLKETISKMSQKEAILKALANINIKQVHLSQAYLNDKYRYDIILSNKNTLPVYSIPHTEACSYFASVIKEELWSYDYEDLIGFLRIPVPEKVFEAVARMEYQANDIILDWLIDFNLFVSYVLEEYGIAPFLPDSQEDGEYLCPTKMGLVHVVFL